MGSPNSIKWRVQLLAYAPALFWLGVIFYLSSGSGASTETSRIIGPFDTLLDISGGLLAVILVWLFLNWRKRKQNPAVTMTAGK